MDRLPKAAIVLGGLLALSAIWLVFNGLSHLLGLDVMVNQRFQSEAYDDGLKKMQLFFTIVLMVPLLETLVFQVLPVYLLGKTAYFKERVPLTMLLSGILFASVHGFSITYYIAAFCAGFLLVYLYVYFKNRTDATTAFLYVFFIHALNNAAAFAVFQLQTT